MAVTLTTLGGIVFTFGEGDIESIQCNIGTDLDFDSMPMMTADSAMLFDFNGVKKTIRASGQICNNGTDHISGVGSAVTIDEQRKALEAMLNGSQSGITFSSNYSSTYNGSTFIPSTILVSNIVFTEQTGNPNNLPFEMTLFVGSA
jgi:hypothetical protein